MNGYQKSRPVVLLGAIIAGMTFMINSLQALFKDNPTIVLVLSIIGIVVSGVAIIKDQFVQSQVVPLKDTVAYVDQQGQPVAGPASSLADGTPVTSDTAVVEGPPPAV